MGAASHNDECIIPGRSNSSRESGTMPKVYQDDRRFTGSQGLNHHVSFMESAMDDAVLPKMLSRLEQA